LPLEILAFILDAAQSKMQPRQTLTYVIFIKKNSFFTWVF
jgi:hypothetical protein